MKKALETIKNLDFKDNYIIVAVSSGPDSMCLLDILLNVTKKIVVAHVNYHQRKQSKNEEKYLKNYCEENNLIFELKDYQDKKSINFQSDAREFRYDHFTNLAKKYKTKYIFTAHHGDDLIETILMRLTRGSILSGYAGFKEISIENELITVRPLIHYTKEEIIEYNKEHKIKYFIDKSNQKNDYTRNRFRNKLLPFFKEEDRNVHKKFYH
ncbi:MAG: tRNA lysidine(34) synthetase TilS, partial [Mollicutes bacterium]|nr:tRNA lysidine(34) synthetase TilS [Mollicutes bacterium]